MNTQQFIRGKMKTNRRGFLGLFGAAAVAGPKVAEANLTTFLHAPNGGIGINHPEGLQPSPFGGNAMMADPKSWAAQELKKLVGKSAEQKARELSRSQVYQHDPNVATLHSVSMTAKIRMSKKALYERQMYHERFNLEGMVNGWW